MGLALIRFSLYNRQAASKKLLDISLSWGKERES
jgi:hypothetical protein